jgi:hypothetical protein
MYHYVILFFGVFPASVFALPALVGSILEFYRSKSFGLWMRILFWTVLLLFSVVDTKIVHYSSLCYFPLSFLAAKVIFRILQEKRVFYKYQKVLLVLVTFIYSALIVGLVFVGRLKDGLNLEKLIKDPFALANLQAEVDWPLSLALIGLIYFGVTLYILFGCRKITPRVMGIFAATLLFTYSTILFITPRIEAYSQRAAIEFYKSLEDQDVYVTTLGFKSYAHLYYSKLKPPEDKRANKTEWLLNGKTDKPVYAVFKIHRKEKYLEQYPRLVIIGEKNGFVFTKKRE